MSDSTPIDQGKLAVEKILGALEVSRVIWVDDNFSTEIPIEEVIIQASMLNEVDIEKVFPEFNGSIPEDVDVLKKKIRNFWTELKPDERDKRAKLIAKISPKEETEVQADAKTALLLSDLVPREKLQELSPSQWNDKKDQLLRDNCEHRTLFLFDQDLSGDGGDTEGGIKIIASLLADKGNENLICGLLTHTITPDNQLESWLRLSKDHNIPIDRFLVIPKQHLNDNPVLFAQTLKLVALSPDFAELKKKTHEIIQNASQKAASEIDAINIYDLDHIVFQTSNEEGIWEPDMLFRLYSLFQRLESRRLAYEGGELETISKRLRSVSHIPTETNFSPIPSTWELQRKELYESADYLNKNHLPLELGDIFEKIGSKSKKKYILLAQPCDLMVRKDGKRHPELDHIPLVEISPSTHKPYYSEEMAYFGDSNEETWYVKLKTIYQIKSCLLDLCVFNSDGVAMIVLGGDITGTIRPSWETRFSIILKMYEKYLKRLNTVLPIEGESPDVKITKNKLKSTLIGDILNEGLFKGQLLESEESPGLRYNCRRIGRLSRARAFGLLMAYTSCLSRPAYQGTFA